MHRLRPKLLTEGVAIIALAPMLGASGVGHEVISAMAAPVLGGLLIADEVVDILQLVVGALHLFEDIEFRDGQFRSCLVHFRFGCTDSRAQFAEPGNLL